MTEVKLTPKQASVVNLLDDGLTVPQVAKKMKISPSGVYGHMRRIRQAGVTLPGEAVVSNGHAKPQVSGALAAAADVQFGPLITSITPEEAIASAIGEAQSLLSEMDAEQDQLHARLDEIQSERSTLVERVEHLDAAQQAL